jgi:hypothetical protein
VCMVANWLNREYELGFLEAWNFNLMPEGSNSLELLGNRIGFGNVEKSVRIENVEERLRIMDQYCGMKLNLHNIKDPYKKISIIKEELLNERPTIFFLDMFWCPWNSYKKRHNPHFCLVVGLDSENNIYCLDYLLDKVVILPFEDFLNGSGECMTFVFEESPSLNYQDILYYAVKRLLEGNTFTNIRKFADDFENSFNFSMEFENFKTNIWEVPIHRNLGFIAAGRNHFANFLELIGKKIELKELSCQINELKNIASKWNTVRGILVKSYYLGFDQKKQHEVSNLLREIACVEETVAAKLLEISRDCKGNKPFSKDKDMDSTNFFMNHSKKKYTFLNLDEHLNNNAFGNKVSINCRADFTGVGHYFLTRGLPAEEIWHIEEMKFKFPKIKEGQNDNISCEQQLINIPQSTYQSIMILASAEYGNFTENIRLIHENAEVTTIIINFSDFSFLPVFNETVAWKGECVQKEENEAKIMENSKRIFAKEFKILTEGVIKQIVLPYCPNIHIFAITLCEYV